LGCSSFDFDRKPEPTSAIQSLSSLSTWPTAGSDHVSPTVFSRADDPAAMSP